MKPKYEFFITLNNRDYTNEQLRYNLKMSFCWHDIKFIFADYFLPEAHAELNHCYARRLINTEEVLFRIRR